MGGDVVVAFLVFPDLGAMVGDLVGGRVGEEVGDWVA